ncbi:hypothetical protein O181_076379 [Austropuccinia psidii MF-1]|uniref:Integrase catalytic domain-containing protein n=1 Tax=Austropuccinia psidii MF-1 TaxID=1389203 RepID=A0A9Q3IFC5_9BASI|nr:hypothetical protein [Austropuccinia psidii MF-1]
MTKLNIEAASIPILDSTNYGEWNARITILLRSRELLEVCEKDLPFDATATAKNKWNKASFDAVSLISSRVSHRVFIEVVKHYSKNAHLLWTKLEEQYASKKAINRGRVWMQWLKSTYNGNLQEYIDNSRLLMMALETVNIHVPAELHTFTLLGKLSGDPKIHQYVEVLSLNEDLVEKPKLVLSKLQDFHNNSKTQESTTSASSATVLIAESSGPYKITYYCSNGKHNPNCTSHSKEECFSEHPELRPPNRRNIKRKTGYNQNASAHISTAQALITRRASLLNNMEFIVDCGATHHILLGICKEKLIITQDNGHFKLESNHQTLIEGKIINNLMRVEFSIPKALSTQVTTNIWHQSHPLDCVHLDLVGPITPSSVSGFCYFLTIVDQATSFKIVQLLKHKSDAFDQFVIVKKEMETLHDRLLKKLVSDRGGEFLNEKFKKLLETHGSNLPNTYWAEAINTSTTLCNLVPTPSRNNRSPYSLWKNAPPRIKKLRVFGCRAVVLIPKHHRDWKLGPVGREGIMLGYENDNTSYRILCLSDKRIMISRHVTFDETTFPSLKGDPQPQDWSMVTWESHPSRAEVVDEIHPVRAASVDELRPEEPAVISGEDQEMVVESHSSSNDSLEDEDSHPVANSHIKVIGPRHPTIYSADINRSNILPFSQRPRVLVTSVGDCPRTYKKALVSADKDLWASAIEKELKSMNNLKGWEVVDLKPDYKLVGTTWVFRIKRNHLNEIIEYKACLCAQGFTQTPGVDFNKTYAPTGRLNSLRTLIAFAVSNNLEFHQVDVKSAFLNAPLIKTVYLSIPQGLRFDQRKLCLRLNKAIYGLKQAPLAWYERLQKWLLGVGFLSCTLDPCVFYRLGQNSTWLYIHVDDIAIFSSNASFFKK